MLYGMLLSTKLLALFTAIGWICHPDILSALVVASLQKDGSGIQEVLRQVKEMASQVSKNTKGVKDSKTNWKNLKNKNLNLTM